MAGVKNITIPQAGLVKGGRLHGWRFHFMRFRVVREVSDASIELVARWTPPAWPFFREFGVDHTYFSTLRPIVGQRAKKLQAAPLMASAFRVEGIVPPPWIVESDMTLRARVKRAQHLRFGRASHG